MGVSRGQVGGGMYKNVLLYQGSKSRMVKHIIRLIPRDVDNFVELFCGSAVLSLHLSGVRIYLNDLDKKIYNFFRVLRDDSMRERFIKLCRLSPFDRATFDEAKAAIESDDPVYRAWGLAVRNMYSFGGLCKAWAAYPIGVEGRAVNFGGNLQNKCDYIESNHFKNFIKYAHVENKDALEVIRNLKNRPKRYKLFFYADPPYIGTDTGSYEGEYNIEDFIALLEELASIKDHRWMLSCFKGDKVEYYKDKYGWQSKSVIERSGVKKSQVKEEMLYWNYDLENRLL